MLFDFLPQRGTVLAGGRRFVCRPPSLAVLFLFLSSYRVQIYALAKASQESKEVFSVEQALPLFLGSGALPYILAECVSCSELDREDLVKVLSEDTELQKLCAMQCLALCDLARILRWLDVSKLAQDDPTQEDGEPVPDDTPADLEFALCEVAQRYGQTPMAVFQWPVEAFLTVLAVGAAVKPMSGAVPQGAEPVNLDSLGWADSPDGRGPNV